MDYFDLYARALLRTAKAGPGTYTSEEMQGLVMSLPPAQFFAEVDGGQLRDLPVVDTDDELDGYIHAAFFRHLGPGEGFVPTPTLVTKEVMTDLPTYPAWIRFAEFAAGLDLVPFLVFHNNPFRRGPLTVYPADMRLGFNVGFMLPEDTPQVRAYGRAQIT